MNPVDIMLCTLYIIMFLKTVETPSPLKWIILGVLFGAGLLNKYTFLVLGVSLLCSLLITKRWKVLRSPWMYVSGMISLFMFLPHIMWQIHQGWPTLEFMHMRRSRAFSYCIMTMRYNLG
jgi:4-amino-4-deoxy-L-arabinose transferase-like glycosyltransferase